MLFAHRKIAYWRFETNTIITEFKADKLTTTNKTGTSKMPQFSLPENKYYTMEPFFTARAKDGFCLGGVVSGKDNLAGFFGFGQFPVPEEFCMATLGAATDTIHLHLRYDDGDVLEFISTPEKAEIRWSKTGPVDFINYTRGDIITEPGMIYEQKFSGETFTITADCTDAEYKKHKNFLQSTFN